MLSLTKEPVLEELTPLAELMTSVILPFMREKKPEPLLF